MTRYVSLEELTAATPSRWSLVGLGTTESRERAALQSQARFDGVASALAEAARRTAIGLEAAARSGDSLCLDDLRAPAEKPAMIAEAAERCAEVQAQYADGLITDGERYNKVVDLWSDATWRVRYASQKAWRASPAPLDAWCERGATADRRDLLRGMVGLMAKASGEIHERPVVRSVGEGLSAHDFFMRAAADRACRLVEIGRTGAARAVHTALRWALDRWRVTEDDCGTRDGHAVQAIEARAQDLVALARRIAGRTLARDAHDDGGAVIACAGEVVDEAMSARIAAAGVTEVHVRWVLGCRAAKGVCARCVGRGWLLQAPEHGARVGARAARALSRAARALRESQYLICPGAGIRPYARSIDRAVEACRVRLEGVERVFRDGGWWVLNRGGFVRFEDEAGREIARGMCVPGDRLLVDDGQRVPANTEVLQRSPFSEHLLATVPEGVRAEVCWTFDRALAVERIDDVTGLTRRTMTAPGGAIELRWNGPDGAHTRRVTLRDGDELRVEQGAVVERGDLLALRPATDYRDERRYSGGIDGLARYLGAQVGPRRARVSRARGWVQRAWRDDGSEEIRVVRWPGDAGVAHRFRPRAWLSCASGTFVDVGDALTDGVRSHRDLLRLWGRERLAEHLLVELHALFAYAGETPEEAHLELVVAAMLSRVRVRDAGDTSLSVGSLISRGRWRRACEAARRAGLREPVVTAWLTGISRLAGDEAARG